MKFLNSCVWTFSTFGYEIWERALNSIWLERMQRLSPVVVVVVAVAVVVGVAVVVVLVLVLVVGM